MMYSLDVFNFFLQMFSVRKRSDSKCFICAKAKRQLQLRQGEIDLLQII
ncbi:hypothetical protein [Lysinibacillus sp. fls2-241-R2A-57]|nr:hypothetical protein [Lysinibacillus sp. fls2-241-R2A-57]